MIVSSGAANLRSMASVRGSRMVEAVAWHYIKFRDLYITAAISAVAFQ